MAIESIAPAAAPQFTQAQRDRLHAELLDLHKSPRTPWRCGPSWYAATPHETRDEADARSTAERRRVNRRKMKPAVQVLAPPSEPWRVEEWHRPGMRVTIADPWEAASMTAETTREACDAIALIRGEAPDVVWARVVGVAP